MSRLICIEGNIGIGKTTLVKKLAAYFNAPLILEEFEENPWLPLFYKEPAANAFALELSFLNDRARQLLKAAEPYKDKLIFSDYCFDKCLLFAETNLSAKDFSLYKEIHEKLSASLIQPERVFILHSSLEHLILNIQKRGRAYEKNIPPAYLDKLNEAYKEYSFASHDYKTEDIFLPDLSQGSYDKVYFELLRSIQTLAR